MRYGRTERGRVTRRDTPLLNFLSGALVAVTLLLFSVANASEWPSLDLPALAAAGNLPAPVEVTVDDPVYHEQKT